MASTQSGAVEAVYREWTRHNTDPRPDDLSENPDQWGDITVEPGDETVLYDARMLEKRARNCGVEVTLDVFAGQQDTFQMAAGYAPETDEGIHRFAGWVRPKLGMV